MVKHESSQKVLIRTDASSRIGSGHLMRCLALAQGLKEFGLKVSFVSNIESKALIQRLENEGFGTICPASDTDTHIFQSILEKESCEKSIKWIILDGYHFNEQYQMDLKNMGFNVLCFDDYSHLDSYYCDILLNQNIGAQNIPYANKTKAKLLLGLEYTVLRNEFVKNPALLQPRQKAPSFARNILVTLGGADEENFSRNVLQALEPMRDNLHVRIILGANNPNVKTVASFVSESGHRMEILQNVADMAGQMQWADAAIGAAGSTCWEMAFLGLPAIVGITAQNQVEIAQGLDKEGIVENIGWYKDISQDKLAAAIQKLLYDSDKRNQMSQKGRKLIDGKGRNRIVEAMQKFYV